MKLLFGIVLLTALAVGLPTEEEERWTDVIEIDLPKPKFAVQDVDDRFNFGTTALLNDYVDNALASVAAFMVEHGLDPLDLPDFEEGVSFKPVLITYSAKVSLTQGNAANLSKLSRSGDNLVNYFAKMLRARVALRLSDIEFSYRYATVVMNLGPRGRIIGSLSYIDVLVDVLIDFNNDEIHLQTFSFEDYGRLSLRLSGNILTDWLVNPVVSLFTRILTGPVFSFIENTIETEINKVITLVNQNVKDILDHIEGADRVKTAMLSKIFV